eukprot:357299-Chlamydomonas_euryale.AAC.3
MAALESGRISMQLQDARPAPPGTRQADPLLVPSLVPGIPVTVVEPGGYLSLRVCRALPLCDSVTIVDNCVIHGTAGPRDLRELCDPRDTCAVACPQKDLCRRLA